MPKHIGYLIARNAAAALIHSGRAKPHGHLPVVGENRCAR